MARSNQIKPENIWLAAKIVFNDYVQHSTIHGVSYITKNGRTWFERVWRICVLIASVLLCGKLIFEAYNISPIIISFTDKPTPIWQIPFPAVTICPSSTVHWNLSKIYTNREEYFHNLTENEKMLTLAANAMCPSSWLAVLQNYTHCNECLETIRKVKISPQEFFVECKFMNKIFNCTEALEEVVFHHSLCYTFNGHKLYRQTEADEVKDADNDWNIDDGYKPTATASSYPRRLFSAGPKYGLSILIKNYHKYYDPYCTLHGVLVEYRMPYDSPQFMTNFRLQKEWTLNLIVKPKMIVTSDEVREYSAQERKCYFSNEYRLKYYRQYTKTNCEIECEIDEVLKICNILPIFIENINGINITGPKDYHCTSLAMGNIASQNYRQCQCLPLCSSVTYESEILMARLNSSREDNDDTTSYSKLNIYFKETQLMTIIRTERYGKTEFLANCGGLLGLCLGVSVLSFMEVIYYCTVRLWITVRETENRPANEEPKPVFVESSHGASSSSRFLDIVQQVIAECCLNTTLQGVRYVGDHDITKTERVWWAIVVGMSIICCGSLISNVLKRFNEAPVIISYANEETPISEIPFPAVTICPQIFAKDVRQAHDYFKVYNKSLYTLDKYSTGSVTAVAQVCDPTVFGDVDPENRTNCANCSEKLKALLGNINDYFNFCQHIYEPKNCSDMFEAVATEDGICFRFNALQPFRNLTNNTNDDITDNWTIDHGYANNTGDVLVHPRAGSKFALTMMFVVPKTTIDNLCKDAIQGFKLFLHLPNELPQIAKNFYLMPYQHFTSILINPRVTVTELELRDFLVEKRQCYFSDERYLRFFRHYTQNNCEIECVANLTISRCGCLMFYMPKIEGVKYCGIGEVMCQQRTSQLSVEQNIKHDTSGAGCRCLPTCTSILYDTEVNHVFYRDEEVPAFLHNGLSDQFRFVTIDMVFPKSEFLALKRSQLFGKTEILANCGGLLGLFLGFSFVSVFELFYFCVIRVFCELKVQLLRGI